MTVRELIIKCNKCSITAITAIRHKFLFRYNNAIYTNNAENYIDLEINGITPRIVDNYDGTWGIDLLCELNTKKS